MQEEHSRTWNMNKIIYGAQLVRKETNSTIFNWNNFRFCSFSRFQKRDAKKTVCSVAEWSFLVFDFNDVRNQPSWHTDWQIRKAIAFRSLLLVCMCASSCPRPVLVWVKWLFALHSSHSHIASLECAAIGELTCTCVCVVVSVGSNDSIWIFKRLVIVCVNCGEEERRLISSANGWVSQESTW